MGRNKIIKKYIQNKVVLDVGFLGENKKVEFSSLHNFIIKNSKEVWGLDIDKDRIHKLKEKGYNVIYDNVQELKNLTKLNKKFDVIIAGELIEHLENPGVFLNSIKEFLNGNGVLVLTTPNMFSLRYILRHTLFGQESPYWVDRNAEIKYGHVIGFSKMLLKNLLLREGFEILEFRYTIKDEYNGFRGNLEKFISAVFPRFAPSLIVVCELK